MTPQDFTTKTTNEGSGPMSNTLNTLFGGILGIAKEAAPTVTGIIAAKEQAKINERNARAAALTAIPVSAEPGATLNTGIDPQTKKILIYSGIAVGGLLAIVLITKALK